MVLFHLAGRVNSEEYAICERLLDILQVTMPDIQVNKTPFRPDKWAEAAAQIATTNGFRVPMSGQTAVCDVIVWSETCRLVSSDADAFSSYVQQYYGVQLDLNENELSLYVKANVDEMKKQQRQERKQ